VSGREIPNQRQRRTSKVVKGMAPEDPTPQSMRFRMKNTTNTTLDKAREGEGWIIITLCTGHNGSPDLITQVQRMMSLIHYSSSEGHPSLEGEEKSVHIPV